MRALTFQGIEQVRLRSIPDPLVSGDGDVIVRTGMTAICGSDLHVYHGREKGLDRGTVLGHEFMGEIIEIGSAVERFRIGDRVLSPFSTSCGSCFYCKSGLTARCEMGQLFGWREGGRGLHGAQAEFVRVPLADSTLVHAPEDLPPEVALLAGDVLSTGLFSAESADIGTGSVVGVVGCGPVGLMAVAAALSLGARTIFAVDWVPERLDLAADFGAIPVNSHEVEPREIIHEATHGRGVDAVLEAVGNSAAGHLAMSLVRPGGTIMAAGVHTERDIPFTPMEAYDKNLSFKTGRCSARHYMERSLAIARSGRYPLGSIISHRLPLEDGVEAYRTFAEKLDRCTKVILIP
ncbi:MAG: alcohol dehydrogenase catalytic domain-containing protein [Thermoanaerobaculia bacterium]